MPRSLLSRSTTALLAVIYLALPGGAWGVRACPHHDALGGHEQMAASAQAHAHGNPAAGAVHVHGDAAANGTDLQNDVQLEAGAASDDGHSGCSCLDSCAASSTPALPATEHATHDAKVAAGLESSTATGAAPLLTRPRFLHPLQNAPPSALR